MQTVNDVLDAVERQLHRAGIDSPAPEAAIIVSHVLGITRGRLGVLQALGERLTADTVTAIENIVSQRATRIPLQHLLGETTFYGVDLTIEPGVFIPRVETEVLVETTLAHFGHNPPDDLKLLDLCTGSGAIAAALADRLAPHGITTRIWAVDLNPHAVDLARRNTAAYNVTVLCADATHVDSLTAADSELASWVGRFDAVVSNPPYIPTETPVTQQEAEKDPQLALYGGSADGLAVPIAIAHTAAACLAPGGFFMMEHDETHAAELASNLDDTLDWDQLHTVQDLTGTDRFVSAVRA